MSTPKKVLVVRKPDGTVHKVPLATKPGLMSMNNKLAAKDKWTLEEMDETEANKLDFIDKNFVSGAEATVKVKELQAGKKAAEDRIAELERLLDASLNKNTSSAGAVGGDDKKNLQPIPPASPAFTAVEQIDKITAATTVDEVHTILGDDTRATVKKAAEDRIAELERLLDASLNKNTSSAGAVGGDDKKNLQPIPPASPAFTAVEQIDKITAATTVDEVHTILGDDTRATVKKAAEKRIAELETAV